MSNDRMSITPAIKSAATKMLIAVAAVGVLRGDGIAGAGESMIAGITFLRCLSI
jgi:hypothetical protein